MEKEVRKMALKDECAKIFIGVNNPDEIISIGNHMLIEIHGADTKLLNNESFVRQTLIKAADEAGATRIGEIVHPFKPQGVTGVVAVSESHITIHTWPEHDYAAADVFFCGDRVDLSLAAEIITRELHAKHVDCLLVIRGPKKEYLKKD